MTLKRFGIQGFTISQPFELSTLSANETLLGDLPATWELPPCLRCGGECIFSDGICAACWLVYQEEIA